MSLWCYIVSSKPRKLPTAKQSGIGERATSSANAKVQEALTRCATSGKRKRYASYTDEDRAKFGKYASENGNAAALKRFRKDIPELGESTVRSFKTKYLAALENSRKLEDLTPITSIPSKKRGRPLNLPGELHSEVQQYIRALRDARTPVSLPLVAAAAKGIVCARD